MCSTLKPVYACIWKSLISPPKKCSIDLQETTSGRRPAWTHNGSAALSHGLIPMLPDPRRTHRMITNMTRELPTRPTTNTTEYTAVMMTGMAAEMCADSRDAFLGLALPLASVSAQPGVQPLALRGGQASGVQLGFGSPRKICTGDPMVRSRSARLAARRCTCHCHCQALGGGGAAAGQRAANFAGSRLGAQAPHRDGWGLTDPI